MDKILKELDFQEELLIKELNNLPCRYLDKLSIYDEFPPEEFYQQENNLIGAINYIRISKFRLLNPYLCQ